MPLPPPTTMSDIRISLNMAPPPVALLSRGNVSRPTNSLRWNLHQIESLRVVSPQYESPDLIGRPVIGIRPDPLVHGVSTGSVATREESRVAWDESFSDLDEIARGVELDGPVPSKPSLGTAKRFLSVFAARGLRAPVVGEVTGRGVSIEFPGTGARTRLTFVIEGDGSITYYELIEGRRWRGRFPNLSSMLPVVWPSSFHRSGLLSPA